MKGTKIEYTIKKEFVDQNKTNIRKVMKEYVNLNQPGVMYSSWTKEDGNSFVHIVFIEEGAKNPIPDMESFKHFQAGLNKNIEIPPKVTELEFVGSTFFK